MTFKPFSPRSLDAAALVEARRAAAAADGLAVAENLNDPTALCAAFRASCSRLSDAEYRDHQVYIAPGIGATHGVRRPLMAALTRSFLNATKRDSPSSLLAVADRLLREPESEARWLAISILERTVIEEPERSWQLLRRAAREASEWITVDSLAHPFGKGILRESYRWAELEQLTVSPSRWGRRLVGSTIATMPFVNRRAGRELGVAARSLPLLALLMGDAEPDVQKALSWAYRSMVLVDSAATAGALNSETDLAVSAGDGNRAWVIRDSLIKLDSGPADRIRTRLSGIRRRAGMAATSPAAELAARFAGAGIGRPMPEPPLA